MISPSKLWPFRSKGRTLPPTVHPTTAAAARILSTAATAPHPRADAAGGGAAASEDAAESEAAGSQGDTPADTRQHARYVPLRPHTTVLDDRGKRHGARIINLSATGVALEADFQHIDADSVTHVGATAVRAGRRIRSGMVFIFEKPLDPNRCNENTTL